MPCRIPKRRATVWRGGAGAHAHAGGSPALRLWGSKALSDAFDGDLALSACELGPKWTLPSGVAERRAARVVRFVDAELDPSPGAVETLRRTLGDGNDAAKIAWFEAVRGCKRRSRRPWIGTPLAPLFGKETSSSGGSGEDARATLLRAAAELQRRGMSPSDCFEAFDTDGNGTLTTGELAVGLRWLLSRATPATCLAVAVHVDADGDRSISKAEFVEAFAAVSYTHLTLPTKA